MQKTHWEDIHSSGDPTEVSWHQHIPTRSLAWIEAVFDNRQDARILDVGSGKSCLVDQLLDRGFDRVAILDISENALRHVRDRLESRGHNVEWFATDLLAFTPAHRFDLWHDSAVLHFLCDPEEQLRYRDVLRATLEVDGHALIATFAVTGPTRCSGLDIVQYDSQQLLSLLGDEFSLLRTEQETHRTPWGTDQLFQYSLFRREGSSN